MEHPPQQAPVALLDEHPPQQAPFALLDELTDDLTIALLSQFRFAHDIVRISAVCRRLRQLSSSNIIWRELCASRWSNRIEEDAWTERAQQSGPDADGHWRAHYASREQAIRTFWPTFCMGAHLRLGTPTNMHFFEPRYRKLVQTAMARDRRFVFAVTQPHAGGMAYICELHNVTVYPDGRADVTVLPIAECHLHSANQVENIAPTHPPLLWCEAEVLPLLNASLLAAVKRAQHRLLVK